MFGPSDYFTIAFYDAEKKFLQAEVGFQFHRILIPPKAAYMRISTEAKDLAAANACELKAFFLYAPQDCVWRKVRYEYGRTQGLSIVDGYKRFENNTFVRGITLGTPKWLVERKKVPTDWEIVLNDAVFKGKSRTSRCASRWGRPDATGTARSRTASLWARRTISRTARSAPAAARRRSE